MFLYRFNIQNRLFASQYIWVFQHLNKSKKSRAYGNIVYFNEFPPTQ